MRFPGPAHSFTICQVAEFHILGKSCSLGLPYAFDVICLFVIFVIFSFGFGGRMLVLIGPVPGHCLSSTYWVFL